MDDSMRKVLLALLWLALAADARASYVPARFMPPTGQVQNLTLSFANCAATTATQNTTVVNADDVLVTYGGTSSSSTTNGTGTTTDVQGSDSYNQFSQVWITTSKVNATTIAVTINRFSTCGHAETVTAAYQVTDLNTLQVGTSERGVVVGASTASFTSCAAGQTRAWMGWLGVDGQDAANYQAVTANGTITGTGGGASRTGWQVVCWK
jgi:hypothetical protein